MGYPYPTCALVSISTCTIELGFLLLLHESKQARKLLQHAVWRSRACFFEGEVRSVYSTAREKKNFGSIKTLQSMLHVNVAARKGILRDKDLL